MCSQCYATGAALAAETATLIGAPIAYAAYRRARRALGLRDTAVAPVDPAPAPPPAAEPRRRRDPAITEPAPA